MENTQRNVIMQIGAMIALYISITSAIIILFAVINKLLPSPADSFWELERAGDSIRYGIALLLVFFPTFVVLTRYVQKFRRIENSAIYTSPIRWLIYLSLLVGGFVILGTLVSTIYNFLNGDITVRFILKALIIVFLLSLACYYFIRDVRGEWVKNERGSVLVGVISSVIVVVTLLLGFIYNETPATIREYKIDEQQLRDLQVIQSGIVNYLDEFGTLPTGLAEISIYMTVPSSPIGRPSYIYEFDETGFQLCAEFAFDSRGEQYPVFYPDEREKIRGSQNWNYAAGNYCFVRTLTASE